MTETHIIQGDCREVLRRGPADSVQCCITSPPYWGLRDYGVSGQLGLEPTPEAYVANMVEVFRAVRRVLRADGTLWLNLGDSYSNIGKWGGSSSGKHATALHASHATSSQAHGGTIDGLKPKDLVGIPWRVALALQADGWYLRSDIIWAKNNPMPESVRDRPTKAHEYVFLLTKSERYFYDHEAIKEDAVSNHPAGNKKHKYVGTGDRKHATKEGLIKLAGVEWKKRNARSVWTINTKPFKEAHFAVFPEELARRCILAGSKPGDMVLDPFHGAGTSGLVAEQLGRGYVGIELNPEYIAISERRLRGVKKPVSQTP